MSDVRPALFCLALLTTFGCYTVGFEQPPPVVGNHIPVAAAVEIPESTLDMTYDVRSAAAGVANRFRIPVGRTLALYADAFLKTAFEPGDDVTIRIDVTDFSVHDFEAHINARFRVERDATKVFDKSYHAEGTGYFSQTAWGGVFAMKSSMRKTTDEAMRSLFAQFVADAKASHGDWMTSTAPAVADTPPSDTAGGGL